ncbi:hypothetical protein METUNv1_01486 [Methyloversatilis universalis FAM5]|uniref:Uncharacterized protein n=1 Tax=Methyloversatilis universalis (strain ATCC BAA-1314 / DSM 25237 / JCM 13912 / CCUG 52030 / FAM5) TaxID=1000565 RepID=F5RB47_METUF|nr:hypothetical protein METUNv1_01486 [Methyloversatilis universalis FAM5]
MAAPAAREYRARCLQQSQRLARWARRPRRDAGGNHSGIAVKGMIAARAPLPQEHCAHKGAAPAGAQRGQDADRAAAEGFSSARSPC